MIGRALASPARPARRTLVAGAAFVALSATMGGCLAAGPRIALIALGVLGAALFIVAIERRPEVGVAAGAITMPFAQHPWWELNITVSDIIIVLTFLAWLFAWGAGRRQPIRMSRPLAIYGLFVLAAGVSLLFPYNPREGLANLLELIFFVILYLLILNTIDTPRKVWTVIAGWLVGASVGAAYGLYHYAKGTATSEFLAMNSRRIVGTHMDPNFFGALLATSLVLCLVLWQRRRGALAGLAVGGGLALLGTALVLTLSRGSLVAAGLGLLTLLALVPRRWRLALGLGCALAALWAVRLPEYKSRFGVWSLQERVRQMELRGDPNQVNRLHGIYIAAVLFSEHPIVGGGLETFRDRMAPYSSRFSLPDVYSCHTVPALLLAETGALGSLLFNAFALLVLIGAIRLARREPATESGMLARHLSAALVVLMVVGLTIAVLYSRFLWIAFALADSLVLARARAARDPERMMESAP